MAKAKSTKSEALEVPTTAGLPRALTGRGMDTVKEVIQTNLGANTGLNFSDLTRISMPAGGGVVWEIPTASGKARNAEEIVGVVVGFQDAKAYWKESLEETGGGSPPDCRSDDMIKGIGDPGILCSECPNNEFGSAEKGEGKACKDLRVLYILSEDSLLPKVLVVPPTSLKSLRKAFLGLATDMEIPYYGVILKFTLEKDKNKAGITFSRIAVEVVDKLDDGSYLKAQAYKEMLTPMLQGATMNVLDNKPTYSEEQEEV